MSERKLIGGDLSEGDIEFFRRELTLITGTGGEAQVLWDMIDSGASIQDGELSEKHESAVDEKKMKIEQSIRIEESIAQGSAMPGMTLRAKRGEKEQQIDLTFSDDLEIDYAKELKKAIDTSGLQECMNETFQESDFSAKQFCTTHYPEKSRAYLNEAEFYCRKAREYRVKGQVTAIQARNYDEQRKNVSQNIEKEHSEVFSYCIQEAVYWKLKAEIYNNSEQDKKRMQNPTKSSSCKILHSENCVTKYVYIPTATDEKNINLDELRDKRREKEREREKMEKIVEQAEASGRLEEKRKRNLEIELENLKMEQAEKDRRREEERERERERENWERDRKLRQEIESRNEKFEQIRRNGEDQLREIKKWLDECEEKDHRKYLEVKRRYEQLANTLKKPLFDDKDLERKLSNLKKLIIEVETWNMNVRELHRDQVEAEEIIKACVVVGAGIGAAVGLIDGPLGAVIAGVLGEMDVGAFGSLLKEWK